jgi:hypothetical protein
MKTGHPQHLSEEINWMNYVLPKDARKHYQHSLLHLSSDYVLPVGENTREHHQHASIGQFEEIAYFLPTKTQGDTISIHCWIYMPQAECLPLAS